RSLRRPIFRRVLRKPACGKQNNQRDDERQNGEPFREHVAPPLLDGRILLRYRGEGDVMSQPIMLSKALLAIMLAAGQTQPGPNPISDGARLNYNIIKGFITRAAEKMPEEKYGFRATAAPDVRTFGQFVGHLADANYRVCSIVAGQDPPLDYAI